MLKIFKDYWVLIFLAILTIFSIVIQFSRVGDLQKSEKSYKEMHEVAISERDYYKKKAEWKSGFDVAAILPDGMNVSIRVNYQDDYSVSVEQRLRMTIAIKEALSDARVIPTTQNKMEKELNYQKMLAERNELFGKILNDK